MTGLDIVIGILVPLAFGAVYAAFERLYPKRWPRRPMARWMTKAKFTNKGANDG
jgi:hypothetical protein